MYSALYFLTGIGFVSGVVIYAIFSLKLAADIKQGRLKVKEQVI